MIMPQIYETARRCYGTSVKATALRLFLVLAILVCTLGHRDAAFAHVSETAVSAVHDLGDDDSRSPASHTGHVAHHHCPPALNEDPGALLADCRLTSGRHGMPADMAALPSRDVAPLPEPPTA
jgi:hypothetical protein